VSSIRAFLDRFGRGRAMLVVGVVVLAGVAVGLAIGILRGSGSGVAADPSSSVQASATAPSSASAEASESASTSAQPSPGDTAAASPAGSPSGVPTSTPTVAPAAADSPWTLAGTFGADGAVAMATDVVAWDGGFVAIGEYWPDGYAGSAYEPRIWRSDDGTAWTDVSDSLGRTDVALIGVARLPAGGVILVGTAGDGIDEPEAVAWRSPDAETWTEIAVPFGSDTTAGLGFAGGPIGIVALSGRELWYSSSDDGADWQLVHEAPSGSHLIGASAGDEGFVVVSATPDEPEVVALASGDGLTWYESDPLNISEAAPLGGDWLATTYDDAQSTITILRSANGLDWATELDVNTLTPEDGPKAGNGMESEITGAIVSADGGVAALTLNWNHCCALPSRGVGVWTSTDGSGWTSAGLVGNASVMDVATDGEVVVMAGYVGRDGADAALWVADR
jgi:hypothetical protein